jgi:uncharacterized protein
VKKFKIEAIAIGNGTASRETETFIRKLGLPASIPIVMVSESGASIYSASDVAREEFPDKDVTVRGAVSIGRRLMDPLAELVKLDPKSIGVGQYQHDVDQTALKRTLDDVVVSCVNNVGVELNTASKHLLAYVSGLNSRVAANIVAHRDEHGPSSRARNCSRSPDSGQRHSSRPPAFSAFATASIRSTAARCIRSVTNWSTAWPRTSAAPCSTCSAIRASARRFSRRNMSRPKSACRRSRTSSPSSRSPGATRASSSRRSLRRRRRETGRPQARHEAPGIVTNVAAFGAFVDIGVHQDGSCTSASSAINS